eukprot:SAG22_NODE_163_length_16829_cov_9.946204_11_plen_560_part_00
MNLPSFVTTRALWLRSLAAGPQSRMSVLKTLVGALALAAVAVQAQEEAAAEAEVDEGYKSLAPEGSVVFFDNFDDEAAFEAAWTVSGDPDYEGEFGLSAGENRVAEGDLGLEIKNEAKKHGIAAKFPGGAVQLGDKPLVIQYELEIEKPHTCGGLYVKLLRDDGISNLSTLNGDSEYTIMFGPDKCGATNKVHFILKHQNPLTKEYEEKHASNAPALLAGVKTHLYALVIKPDNSYEFLIDQESVATGNLLETMEPSVNPPKQIDDPEDFKPEDWVDEPQMDDPEASKPDDWDEDAPLEIVDPEATMPEDWDEEAALIIADPSASMPEDWDEEEDGEWEAPRISNPECAKHGCEKWVAPNIQNPEYKGKWTAPQVDNPAYKGVWAPKQIDNPGFFEDAAPQKSTGAFGAVAIEIWTMTNGIFFDNMLITQDVRQAEDYATKTWAVKAAAEAAAEKAAASSGDPLAFAQGLLAQAATALEGLGVPGKYSTIAVLSALAVIVLTTVFMCCMGGGDEDPTDGLAGGTAEEEEEAEAEEAEAEEAEEPAADEPEAETEKNDSE